MLVKNITPKKINYWRQLKPTIINTIRYKVSATGYPGNVYNGQQTFNNLEDAQKLAEEWNNSNNWLVVKIEKIEILDHNVQLVLK